MEAEHAATNLRDSIVPDIDKILKIIQADGEFDDFNHLWLNFKNNDFASHSRCAETKVTQKASNIHNYGVLGALALQLEQRHYVLLSYIAIGVGRRCLIRGQQKRKGARHAKYSEI